MANEDPPELDKYGSQPEEVVEGSLLFQPSGDVDPDDDDFFLPEEPDPPSKGPLLWMVAALVVLGVSFGLPLLGSSDDAPDIPPEAMPVAPSLPVDTASRAELRAIPSDTVEGPIGSSVRVAIRALGPSGAALSNATARFEVESGGGALRDNEAQTTGEGIAVNFFDLPDSPGESMIRVAVPETGLDPIGIVAITHPGPPARIAITAGNGEEAEVGSLIPGRRQVTVYDSLGNPVPGVIVTFRVASGDGISAPSQTRADSLGNASALWRLGPLEGEQTLVASASGLDQEVTFTATATASATLEFDNPAPTETSPVTVVRNSFAVGGSHACTLDGGSIACWGDNGLGQAGASGSLGFVAVAAGSSHTCALNSSGIASCWGANDAGQLGDGSRDNSSTPTRVRTELRFSQLAAGADHTCGLAGGGVPVCWGENLSGQLGDGSRIGTTSPKTVGGGLGFVEITAGWTHTCGRTRSGNTFCWGANNNGQLGDGSGLDRQSPSRTILSASNLVAGSTHTCGISDGRVHCWGGNDQGQLGDGTTTNRDQPTAVQGLPGTPTDLAAGAVHTCALFPDGRVFCWGQGRHGQLGDGSTETRTSPVSVAGELRFTEIDAGGGQTCGTARDGNRYCWGFNLGGQLGDGTRTSRSVPTRVVVG